MSSSKISSIKLDTFVHNVYTFLHIYDLYKTALQLLGLKGNNITDVHPSTFRNNSRLRHLDMSGNKINSIQPDTFIHNMALERLDFK
jgi:Leucine-rich repeat (LRR) protein